VLEYHSPISLYIASVDSVLKVTGAYSYPNALSKNCCILINTVKTMQCYLWLLWNYFFNLNLFFPKQ